MLDDFGGRLGRAWPETDEERTDREIVITDLTRLIHQRGPERLASVV